MTTPKNTEASELPKLPTPWIIDGSTKDPAARHHYAEDQMIDIRAEAFEAGKLVAIEMQASHSAAADAVLAERQRQIHVEGWSAERDDKYTNCELARAAATYAVCSHVEQLQICGERAWPWHIDWFKRTTYRRDLVKAGALILAEIERLDRDDCRAIKQPTTAPAATTPAASESADTDEGRGYCAKTNKLCACRKFSANPAGCSRKATAAAASVADISDSVEFVDVLGRFFHAMQRNEPLGTGSRELTDFINAHTAAQVAANKPADKSAYLKDMEDTLDQIAKAVGCERDADRLIVAVQKLVEGKPAEEVSQVYDWLSVVAKSEVADVRNAALAMMAYYQGAEFPEPAAASGEREQIARIRRMIIEHGSAVHFHWPLSPMALLEPIMMAIEALATPPSQAPALPATGEALTDDQQIEIVAAKVFEAMTLVAGVATKWVPGGNSLMQDEARTFARAIIAALKGA